ncbi:hypothetical protein IEQ34_026181 [Dendrobium chrysotoxum]|uniref:Uncharacterized protein n=1 Tax=Dendrobium chrysotoxum TaxID=161865 RepID=A0AAV7FMJ4_DENCH|nr:hypothetical protein IEQ34_026170 [Dendrobium chrysotoxum]KAH0437898.1 hypothetical protein IEQ34_026181 [Dendrobium chrysotoxum]
MSTTGRGRHSALRIFKGRRGRTGRRSTCGALPAAGPYLRLSRFQGWQAIRTDGRSARAHAPSFTAAAAPSYSSGPGHCPDGRSDERFARQYRCGPPPEFPLASPRSGIVHHLSGPDTHAHTRTLHKRSGSVGGAPVKEDPAHQLPCAHRASTPGCIPKQPDSPTTPRVATGFGPNGALTLPGAPFQGTWARSVAEDASPDYNSSCCMAARFQCWAYPGSLAVTRGILVSFFSSAY